MPNACLRCNGLLDVQPGAKPLGQTADGYNDCWEVCPACRIGLSNAKAPLRTFIRKDWKEGLWRPSTADRLEAIVKNSLGVRSRTKKIRRLANERSEDLLSWNVFSWLEDRDLLGKLLAALGHDERSNVQIFYWGANDRYALPLDLKGVLVDHFHESPNSVSEPDVILISATRVVFIEAKLGSPNDHRPDDFRVAKYHAAMPGWFGSLADVRKAGFYELTRNWAIGAAVATTLGKEFTLVNLVRAADEQGIESLFGTVLRPRGVFRRYTWERLAKLDEIMVPCLKWQTVYFEPAFPSLVDVAAVDPDAYPAGLDDQSFPFLQRLRLSGVLNTSDWARIIDWLFEALWFLKRPDQTVTVDPDGSLIINADADPRNAEWLNLVHVFTLARHRIPGWAALWLGWLAHDRGPQFWRRVAAVARKAGLEETR